MHKVKRITANLPAELLEEATAISQLSITETLIQGLRLVKRSCAYEKAQKLKGKISLDIDLDLSRERRRH